MLEFVHNRSRKSGNINRERAMSVSFERETIRNAPVAGDKHHGLVHKLGEKLTGGNTASGYLAVC